MIKRILGYKEIFFATKPTYWWKFYKYTYIEKRRDSETYLKVPESMCFSYLKVCPERFLKVVNAQPKLKEQIISYADEVCKEHVHIFNITTEKIIGQWHKDPVTNYEWPKIFYKDVRKLTPQGSVIKNNDIKYPWEISCAHFFVTLSQAYLLTKDRKYYEMFFIYLDDWIKENPITNGVTWSCTLDVAMRAVNWIIAASIFNVADKSFNGRFYAYRKHLYSHMLFINDNLEYGFVRENHYLSDIVGLKMIAQCFPDDVTAKVFYKKAAKSLREEILYQVCIDGVDHEASTCYHGFVFDLFMMALATDERLRKSLTSKEVSRLQKMLRFTDELCQFQLYPIVGDNDGERVTDLNGYGTFRKEIVNWGKQVLGLDETSDNEYSMLIDGDIKPLRDNYTSALLRDYKCGGYALVNNINIRLLLHCGNIGRKGKGGHGHNDQTSFIMDVRGESFIIDPGSMVYERDLQLRHEFRGTAIHNCVMVGDKEQNNMSINKPFKMDNDTKAFYTSEVDGEKVILTANHKGYEDKSSCACMRKLSISDKDIIVVDILDGAYTGTISCLYTFAKGVVLSMLDNCIIASRNNKQIATITADGWNMNIVNGRYSPTYGIMTSVTALELVAIKDITIMELHLNIIIE